MNWTAAYFFMAVLYTLAGIVTLQQPHKPIPLFLFGMAALCAIAGVLTL